MSTQALDTNSTEAVIQRHLSAIPAGIDTILADYDEQSVLFTQEATFTGSDGVRAFFEAVLQNSPPDLFRGFAVIRLKTHGPFGYLLWKAEPYIPLATDTFVVRDGKIIAQTFTALPPA